MDTLRASGGALEKACSEHAQMTEALAAGDRERLEELSSAYRRKVRAIYEDKFLKR